jgi:hypothetical protein
MVAVIDDDGQHALRFPCRFGDGCCPHTGEDRGDDEGAPAAGRILDHRLEFGPRGEIDAFAQWPISVRSSAFILTPRATFCATRPRDWAKEMAVLRFVMTLRRIASDLPLSRSSVSN